MRKSRILALALCLVAVPLVFPGSLPGETAGAAWTSVVARALGKEGSLQPGEVYKVGFPRTDLKVTLGNLRIEPGLALGSWAAFKRVGEGDEVMVMGDLVLLAAEVNPLMTRLLKSGLDVTALHNHLLGETPRLMYLHYEGRGGAGTSTVKSFAEEAKAGRRIVSAPK